MFRRVRKANCTITITSLTLAILMYHIAIGFILRTQWEATDRERSPVDTSPCPAPGSLFQDFEVTGTLPPPTRHSGTKLILFWKEWYKGLTWRERFGNYTELKEEGCPEWRCEFTYDRNRLEEADAILFKSDDVRIDDLPPRRNARQRWVWVEVEAPLSQRGANALSILTQDVPSFNFNWTMTYHSSSEVIALNGYFITRKFHFQPLRPNLMSHHTATMKLYLEALDINVTLEQVMGPSWRNFVTRPKLIAWMSSHCPTSSRREEYVYELQKYIPVDIFGFCGQFECGMFYDAFKPTCWQKRLRPQYLFYMSMENSLCDEYISEKLYNPLIHGLVPVVYGSSNYDDFLPPHSYINARHYHPKELGELLTALQRDPFAYGRYHVWRDYWQATLPGSFCELCHRLHHDNRTGHHIDIVRWRQETEKCFDAPVDMFSSDAWRTVIDPMEKEEEKTKNNNLYLLLENMFCILAFVCFAVSGLLFLLGKNRKYLHFFQLMYHCINK